MRAAFEMNVYGTFPSNRDLEVVDHTVEERSRYHLHQMRLRPAGIVIELAIFVPRTIATKAVLVGPNFIGNHSVSVDPAVRLSDRWMPSPGPGVVDHRATDDARGRRTHAWAIDAAMNAGVAVATFYAGDVWPDHPQAMEFATTHPFRDRAREDATGALAAWAWGLHRASDAITTLPELSKTPQVVWGHSRQGKAALVAAAFDDGERFAGVISNQSGCGGAALFRGKVGEQIKDVTSMFPYWFAPRFAEFAGREGSLPLDQHWLLGLIAPRALLVCSAVEDEWADPTAEHRAVIAARPAWEDPSRVEYSVRPGKHSVTEADWTTYLSFVDRQVVRA